MIGVVGAVAAAIAVAGCGADVTNPLCPDNGCPSVHGVVERCVGAGLGDCKRVPVKSVSLFASDGLAEGQGGPTPFSAFMLSAEVPGRYSLKATIDGHQVTSRTFFLRDGENRLVNLTLRVPRASS